MIATAPGCELDVERGPDWLLVTVRSLSDDPSDTDALIDQLWSLMERHFTYRLVLELDQLDVLGSYLIGQLVQLRKRVGDHDGVLRLCGLSADNRRVLRMCRLDDLFLPYQSRREAVMGYCRLRRPK
jgi:anti-anti-sigma factor